MRINYSSNEKALPLRNSEGKLKSRIHLYAYSGEKGKDPYAIAAKKLKQFPRFHIPFLKNRYVILKEESPNSSPSFYKINKNSLCKRLGIKASELEQHVNKDRAVAEAYIEEKFNACLNGAYQTEILRYKALAGKKSFTLPQYLDQEVFIKKLAPQLINLEIEELELQNAKELTGVLKEKISALKALPQLEESKDVSSNPKTAAEKEELAFFENKLALYTFSNSAFMQNLKALQRANSELEKAALSPIESKSKEVKDKFDLKDNIHEYFNKRLRPDYKKDAFNSSALKAEKDRLKQDLKKFSSEEQVDILKQATFDIGHLIQDAYFSPAKEGDYHKLQNVQKALKEILELAEKEFLDLVEETSIDKKQFLNAIAKEPLYQTFDVFIICKYRLWEYGKEEDRLPYFKRLVEKMNFDYFGFAFSQLFTLEDLKAALDVLNIEKYKKEQEEIDAITQRLTLEARQEQKLEWNKLLTVYQSLSPDQKIYFQGTPFYDPKDLENRKVEELGELQISF